MTNNEIARAHLRSEMQRILTLLDRRLAAQRSNGRTPVTDPLRGVAIEEGEAERLLASLAVDLARPQSTPPSVDSEGRPRRVNELPLQRAQRVFRMDRLELDALVLALSVELDERFARIVAYLNDHVARTRPTVGLVLSLIDSDMTAVDFCEAFAMRSGLLQTEGDGPKSGLTLRVASEILTRLVSAPGASMPAGIRLRSDNGPDLDGLILGLAQREKLGQWAVTLGADARVAPIVLSGPAGSGRATSAHAASSSAGRPLVEVLWPADPGARSARLGVAAREALWYEATLLVRLPEAMSDSDLSDLWSTLAAWDVPIALAVVPELVEPLCAAAPSEPLVIALEPPGIEQREILWHRLLKEARSEAGCMVSAAERRELAARYDFLPGAISRSLRRALMERRDSRDLLDFESLSRACRAVGTAAMGPIAQRLSQPYARRDLILPQELLEELDLALAWMQHRRRVFEDWGFGRRMALGQGLTALFSGPPGTGKTMAAQVLARELGLELFRVDLSRVMSKYIGESEKNLSRLFDDARGSGAILFFDEADALFGKRTEVKDAHDRYANLEISYLLQRMEEHAGTTVLATNRMGDLDEAFTRRFHFILDFPMPRPAERRRIWEGMLPESSDRDPDMDLDGLARDYEISGGEIRNSVLSAAFIAAREGSPIGLRHLKRGLRRELLKTGRVLDMRQRTALDGD